jgi:hypothetical protein
MEIKNPEWLLIKYNGKDSLGPDQEWYSSTFKRAAGCGPISASTILIYLNRRGDGPLPYKISSPSDVNQMIENVWHFITPGVLGLNSPKKFVKGMKKLIKHYGAAWSCNSIIVKKRNSIKNIASFVESGIASDCPVAFLNLHAGTSTEFEGWHWITIIGINMCGGTYIATAYDNGKKITFDLGAWASSTKLGGGFVYLK